MDVIRAVALQYNAQLFSLQKKEKRNEPIAGFVHLIYEGLRAQVFMNQVFMK